MIKNCEKNSLNNCELNEDQLLNIISNKKVNTIILPSAVYALSQIREWPSFIESSTRNILTKGDFGTWNKIKITVRKMNSESAVFLTEMSLNDIEEYRKNKYYENLNIDIKQLVKLNQKLKGHLFSAHGIKSEVVGTLPNKIAIVKMFPYNADEYFAFVSSELIKDKTHY
jgi:hypothetical protein